MKEYKKSYIFNIYNINKHLLSSKIQDFICHTHNVTEYNQQWNVRNEHNDHIRMISEGSCDTEDWSNDAENSALPSHIN